MNSKPAAVSTAEKSRKHGLFAIVKETGADWLQDNAMRLAAALSLYTILSLAPLLVISLKIIAVVWRDKEHVQQKFMDQITLLMGSDAASAVQTMLANGGKHGEGVLATVISLLVLLFSATGVFAELQDSMNTIWGVKPKPNQGIWGFVRNRLLSMGMVLGIAFLLLVSMFVSAMMSTMAGAVAGNAKWIALPLDITASFCVVSILFAAIFKFLPDVKITWREVWPGAVFTAALFIVGKYGLALYFKYATPTSAFGAAGSLAAVLLWVYYSSFILFFGAEFTKVWSLHYGGRLEPADNAMRVTEDDRAQRGIPTRKREKQAAEGSLSSQADTLIAPYTGVSRRSISYGPLPYAMAAGALAIGYAVGYLLEKRNGDAVEGAAAQMKFHLKNINGRLQQLSGIKRIST